MSTLTLTFDYLAVDRMGAKRKGSIIAANQGEAYRKVASLALTPLNIKAQSQNISSRFGSERIKSKDLANFTYQLGVLVSARISIAEGLLGIAQQEKDGKLKDIILDIAKRIQSGEQIASAMEKHRGALGEVYVETIRAAEKSGNLPRVLEHLSEMLEKSQEQARQVKGALMYPACVVTILTMAVLFLVGFVVPKFANMFASRKLSLPFFTKVLLVLGNSLQNYWYVYLIVVAGIIGIIRWMWIRPAGRIMIDRSVHHVPYIRDILIGSTMSRFCRIFAMSLQSGLGLIESLDLAGKSAGRAMLMTDVHRMIAQVRAGGRLMEVLGSCMYITPFAKRMLVAGEQAAEIPRMCGVISRHYDRETSHLTKNLSTIIEPVLIVSIAGIVLVVALAIFMPMWDMGKIVSS